MLHQRVKISHGADGSATDVSSASPLPVTLANTGANATAVKVDGSAVTQPVSGTVAVSTVNSVAPAFGSGVRGATVQRVTIATDDSVPVTGTFWQATQPVSMATNTPVGTVAHDAADSGAPIKVGGRARTSDVTAVASDDRVDAIFDKIGRMLVLPYSLLENLISGAITTSMTGTTSTSLISAPGAGLYNYITQVTVSNAHATQGTDVALQDGNGGTTFYTIPAAAVYGGAAITFNPPLKQPTSNTALYCANITTGASTKVSASGFKGA